MLTTVPPAISATPSPTPAAAADNRALLRRLLSYMLPYWQRFLVAMVGMVVAAVTQPALAALMKPLLDGTFVHRDPFWIRLAPVLIVGLMLVQGFGTFVSVYGSNWLGNKVVYDLRTQMFRKLLSLPTAYFESNASGIVVSRFTFDAMQVALGTSSVATVIIKDGLSIIALMGYLLYLNWKLTLLTFVIVPPIMLVVGTVSRRLRAMSEGAQEAMGDLNQVLNETTAGVKVVKAFGGQGYEAGRFAEQAARVRRFNMKRETAAAANWPLVQVVVSIGVAAIVYLAVLQSANDQTTVGGFVSFLVAAMLLIAPLKRLTTVNESMQRSLAAAATVFEFLDEPEEADTGSVTLERARGAIRYEHASFAYAGSEARAVDDVSLDILPGETVALVGPSGAGKTTLVALLPRFYELTGGRIQLDGHDLAELTLASLRANISFVSQEIVLFDDTHRGEHRLRRARGCHGRRDHRRRPGGARVGFHFAAAAGPADAGGGARRQALGRSTAAHRDRPCLPQGRAGAGAGRGDVCARRGVRAPRAGSARHADARAHHARHRPPPVDGRERRPHRRAGARAHRRDRQAR